MVLRELTDEERDKMEYTARALIKPLNSYIFYNIKPSEEFIEKWGGLISRFVEKNHEAHYVKDEWVRFLHRTGISLIPEGKII